MSTSEKANELIEKFWHKISGVPDSCGVDINSDDTYVILSKQCAIICVDEILDSHFSRKSSGYKTYWLNVKKEILKL